MALNILIYGLKGQGLSVHFIPTGKF